MDDETDPVALAASTAQGWTHALNTVARPAPEHLEAAHEALNALVRLDGRASTWPGVRNALTEALTAARLRVDGRPAITVDQLLEALGQLRAAGLAPDPQRPDPALAQAMLEDGTADRIAELEEQLEEDAELASAELAELRDQLQRAVALRDRFEREAAEERDRAKGAHRGHSAAIAAAHREEGRRIWLAVLAGFGMNPPGFADMETVELEREARLALTHAAHGAEQMRTVVKELTRAGRRLQVALEPELTMLPDGSNPPALADAVVGLAATCIRSRAAAFARQRELEDQVLAIRDAMPLHEDERAEAAARDVAQRRRIAELEAVVQLRANDSDEVLARQLEYVRAERDHVMRSRDAQAEAMRSLRAERDAEVQRCSDVVNRAETMMQTEKDRADRLEAHVAELSGSWQEERGRAEKLAGDLLDSGEARQRLKAQLAYYQEADER